MAGTAGDFAILSSVLPSADVLGSAAVGRRNDVDTSAVFLYRRAVLGLPDRGIAMTIPLWMNALAVVNTNVGEFLPFWTRATTTGGEASPMKASRPGQRWHPDNGLVSGADHVCRMSPSLPAASRGQREEE